MRCCGSSTAASAWSWWSPPAMPRPPWRSLPRPASRSSASARSRRAAARPASASTTWPPTGRADVARARTAILISGRGSNMAALLEAAAEPAYPAEIALVLANRGDAAGLARAAAAGIPTAVVESRAHRGDRPGFEAAVEAVLAEHRIGLIALAGFMRVLTPEFVGRWDGRLVNIHPSLLPAFPGLE